MAEALDYDRGRRDPMPISPVLRRAFRVCLALVVLSLALGGLYVARIWINYTDYLENRAHLRNVGYALEQYARAYNGTYPPTLADLPQTDPAVRWAMKASRFAYLGAGLTEPVDPDVIVARYRPIFDVGELFQFGDSRQEFCPDADIPKLLATSAARRAALGTATSRPTSASPTVQPPPAQHP